MLTHRKACFSQAASFCSSDSSQQKDRVLIPGKETLFLPRTETVFLSRKKTVFLPRTETDFILRKITDFILRKETVFIPPRKAAFLPRRKRFFIYAEGSEAGFSLPPSSQGFYAVSSLTDPSLPSRPLPSSCWSSSRFFPLSTRPHKSILCFSLYLRHCALHFPDQRNLLTGLLPSKPGRVHWNRSITSLRKSGFDFPGFREMRRARPTAAWALSQSPRDMKTGSSSKSTGKIPQTAPTLQVCTT